jgi:hypothetical protein
MVILHFYIWTQRTSPTHIRGCRGDSNQYNITLQGINLATRYTWATKATWVATFYNDYQKVEPGPPYPSVVFHVKTSTSSPWVAWSLSQCHRWNTVGCCPTRRSSKVLSLWHPINPICTSTQLNACCNRAQPTWSLIDSGEGYHIRSSEYENRPLSSFPSGIFHFPKLPCSVSHKATNPITNMNHIEPPSWERALSWAVINHSSSTKNLLY